LSTGPIVGGTQAVVVQDMIPLSGTNKQFIRLQVTGQ